MLASVAGDLVDFAVGVFLAGVLYVFLYASPEEAL